MEYNKFIESKTLNREYVGIDVDENDINEMLFGFQRNIVKWALEKGKSAIFADTGLGKTFMQIEWAKHIHDATGGDVLILAPLAVAGQTVNEAKKLDVVINFCRDQSDIVPGINITNYEMLRARAQGVTEATIWMGMTIDELQRVKVVTGRWEKRYPLVELRMTRGDCIALVKDMGWPEPPKSTCWMCPNKLPSHWESLRGTTDWHRAVVFEEEMQKIDPDLYLHRQGVNLQDIEEDTDQYDMFCDSGMCFV